MVRIFRLPLSEIKTVPFVPMAIPVSGNANLAVLAGPSDEPDEDVPAICAVMKGDAVLIWIEFSKNLYVLARRESVK